MQSYSILRWSPGGRRAVIIMYFYSTGSALHIQAEQGRISENSHIRRPPEFDRLNKKGVLYLYSEPQSVLKTRAEEMHY